MLGKTKPDDAVWSELLLASQDPQPLVRHEVVAVASTYNTARGLRILIQALEDTDTENVAAAITGMRLYEDETSIRWLLRLFAHPDPAVKIVLAECFAYFFQEEEAVVHRKYLALPYLIGLLDDAEPKVRAAAARSLANAERFRGIHALLGHLKDPDPLARAEIVRCLGLIRQTQAIPPLTQLLADADQPAQVIASSFTALKRLGQDGIEQTLVAFMLAQSNFSAVPLEKRLSVLADLLAQDKEAAVFEGEQLKQLAQSTFTKFLPTNEPTEKEEGLVQAWLHIQPYLGEKTDVAWLKRQIQTPDTETRWAAYQALLALPQNGQAPFLRQAWSDKEKLIRQWALTEMLHKKIALTPEDYHKVINDPEFRDIALQIWTDQGFSEDTTALLKALQSVFASQPTSGVQESKANELEQICIEQCFTSILSATLVFRQHHRKAAVGPKTTARTKESVGIAPSHSRLLWHRF
jgi:HEAT repeat protein